MDTSAIARLHVISILGRSQSCAPSNRPQVVEHAGATDEALLLESSLGNRDALSLLFKRYARLVRGVAYRVLRDTAEADDLLQDVFILIDRVGHTFDGSKGSARSWILQMTYRRAISRRRYLTSRSFYQAVNIEDVADKLTDGGNQKGQLGDSFNVFLGSAELELAFGLLSEGQRQTLRLFFTEGYTFDEIAAKLGQSRGNIKHHYFRGLERLRRALFWDTRRRHQSLLKIR